MALESICELQVRYFHLNKQRIIKFIFVLGRRRLTSLFTQCPHLEHEPRPVNRFFVYIPQMSTLFFMSSSIILFLIILVYSSIIYFITLNI